MTAKNYDDWEPSNKQVLELAEAADVFGRMVWDAAEAQNSTSINTIKAAISKLYLEHMGKSNKGMDELMASYDTLIMELGKLSK